MAQNVAFNNHQREGIVYQNLIFSLSVSLGRKAFQSFYVAIRMFAQMFFKRSDIKYQILNVKINFALIYSRSDGYLSADAYQPILIIWYMAFYSIFSFFICNPSQDFDSKNKTKVFHPHSCAIIITKIMDPHGPQLTAAILH